MTAAYNKVLLVGNLTKDPQIRYLENGVAVNNYFIAVSRPYKNAQGIQDTDFFKIVCWRKLAEICEKYLRKGDKVLVDGMLRTGTYVKDGQTHFTTEIDARKIQFLRTSGKDGETFDKMALNSPETDEPGSEDIPF